MLRLRQVSVSVTRLPRVHPPRYAEVQSRSYSAATNAPVAAGEVGAGAADSAKPPSRWQKLKEERRKAPAPKHRSKHEFDRTAKYPLSEALAHVRSSSWAGFDETVELVFRLKLDPRRAEQNIRGIVPLPHGSGTEVKVAVFTHPGPAADEAREAGADLVGGEELVEEVAESRAKNLAGFAACLTTPEFVPRMASKVGRILGPKGLMPNAKTGSVTGALGEAVAKLKKGQCAFRVDRFGNVHLRAGKLSFSDPALIENILSLTRAILAARPEVVRKKYMLAVHLTSSMGPSAKVDPVSLTKFALDPSLLPPLDGEYAGQVSV
jgi:large subunit ribosomal protein L1